MFLWFTVTSRGTSVIAGRHQHRDGFRSSPTAHGTDLPNVVTQGCRALQKRRATSHWGSSASSEGRIRLHEAMPNALNSYSTQHKKLDRGFQNNSLKKLQNMTNKELWSLNKLFWILENKNPILINCARRQTKLFFCSVKRKWFYKSCHMKRWSKKKIQEIQEEKY